MSGESSASFCPKCRNRLLWNGAVYRCLACEYEVAPKARKARAKPPRRRRGKP